MSFDLVLKPSCDGCKSTAELYGSACKHATLCVSCGKKFAREGLRCGVCGDPVTKLIREYNVRASSNTDKSFYIGRFVTGIPPFSRKKSAENRWTLHKEGLPGRQLTDAQREKYKNRPWILEDETGQHQFQGQLEGAQSATYYLLMMQGREFVAMPSGSWYNFNKIAQYKQLTLEEAEEKMSKRRNNASGYERWMMKTAANGSAAFGEKMKIEDSGSGGTGNGRPKKGKSDAEGNHSDRGEEDEEEEVERKNRLGLNRKVGDDDEDGGKVSDLDLDDDIEKGDDWEHEEIFTDDDEAVGNDPEERDELAPEMPAPPEIKQDDEEEEEGAEEEGGLSKSGKELKKLLGKAGRLDESDAEEDEDEDEADDEAGNSPALAPKQKDGVKEEPLDSSPAKMSTSTSAKSSPAASKSSKSKRKTGSDDAKPSNGSVSKKSKTENEIKPVPVKVEVKADSSTSSRVISSVKGSAPPSSKSVSGPSESPVTEEEIRNVLLTMAPVTTQDLVAKFKARLKCQEDKSSFADILRRISKIQKTNGHSYVVLREK